MDITITRDNINQYRNNKFYNINIINWNAGRLDKKVIDNFPNLHKFRCYSNKIKSLEPFSDCVSILELHCSGNKITSLEPLSNCINLQKLYCGGNKITSLEPLSNCVNLQILNFSGNKITSLEPLSNCISLQKLYCSGNKITSIEPLSNCINLWGLFCNNNQITSLEPLSNCVNLKRLYCDNNRLISLEPLSNCVNLKSLIFGNTDIKSLEPLSNCINLQELYCGNNQITSLEPLIYLRRLTYIDYSDNPIEIPTIQIQRILNRIDSNRKSSIYDDKQNVHDTEIQRTVCESIQNLLKDPKIDFTIDDVINSSLNKSTIESIIEYCQDQTIHSVHLITYQELFSLIWNRIQNSIHKTELLKILEEQIADSECKCFTGRFNRTLSVLVGFYNDIKINISDKSRISAIILNSKEKIIPYDVVKHKELVIKELIDAGYLESDFKDWIEAIED